MGIVPAPAHDFRGAYGKQKVGAKSPLPNFHEAGVFTLVHPWLQLGMKAAERLASEESFGLHPRKMVHLEYASP